MSEQPTPEQLLNLADCAGRRRPSPDEAARLRDGIQRLVARAREEVTP